MKKIILIITISLLVVILGLAYMPLNNSQTISNKVESYARTYNVEDAIHDEKVSIRLERDNTKLKLIHESEYEITQGIFEYSYTENNVKYSQLDRLQVIDDIATIPNNWADIKLHQIKVKKNNVTYTYSVDGDNVIGNFDGVTRIGITEIKTVATNAYELYRDPRRQIKRILYEFYFNFDKDHDYIDFIDVEYTEKKKSGWWLWETTTYNNIEKRINKDDKIEGSQALILPPGAVRGTFAALEKNTDTSINANYVTRVHSDLFVSSMDIENFAIVKIQYFVDGEFKLDEVLNDPVTPLPPESPDLLTQLIDFLNSLFGWNLTQDMVIKVLSTVIGVVVLIMLLPTILSLIPMLINMALGIIKLLAKSILAIFKLVGMILKGLIKTIKFMLIPPSKKTNA